jgi:hypothetical protein
LTTLKAHRSANKPKPILSWMQSSTEAPLEGWTPPAKTGAKPPTRPAPPDKGKPTPKHTPAKPSTKARAAAHRTKPKGAR